MVMTVDYSSFYSNLRKSGDLITSFGGSICWFHGIISPKVPQVKPQNGKARLMSWANTIDRLGDPVAMMPSFVAPHIFDSMPGSKKNVPSFPKVVYQNKHE